MLQHKLILKYSQNHGKNQVKTIKLYFSCIYQLLSKTYLLFSKTSIFI